MFQIWFDPNLEATLTKPASYDDYRSADFPVKAVGNTQIKTLAGPGSPFLMDTPGIEIFQVEIGAEPFHLKSEKGKIYSAYLLEGEANFNGETARQFDFVQVTGQEEIVLDSQHGARIFVIASPMHPGYSTYGQLRG